MSVNPKFFGDSFFGGDFYVKNLPLSGENPIENNLKISFQEMGNNLVITARNSQGKTLTVFGVSDTTSLDLEITNKDGVYTSENENVTWNWVESELHFKISIYGFLKAVLYDNEGKEVFYPVKKGKKLDETTGEYEDELIIIFPNILQDNEIYNLKLLYSYNGLDVATTLGDVAVRNVGITVGNVPVVEKNGKLNYSIIPQFHSYTVENIDSTSLHIDYKNGNVQKIIMNSNLNLLIDKDSNFNNDDRIIFQIQNYGYILSINGIELDTFYGIYNFDFVKINNNLQLWDKYPVRELK